MSLANDGTVFRKAFCSAPTCSPSRAALLTGQSPHACGMMGLVHLGHGLNDYGKHIAAYLASQGIETFLSGIQHEGRDDCLGYSKIIHSYHAEKADSSATFSTPEEYYAADRQTAIAASDFLSKRENPFFLSCGFFATHRPFLSHKKDEEAYVKIPEPLPDCDIIRSETADFIASARHADTSIGMVIDALKKSGKYEDTMIIYTTDHGIAFPYMKCSLFDTGIGVSLIIKLPKGYDQIKISDSMVSHLDIYPTVCDILQIETPKWLEGRSIMPLFTDNEVAIRSEIFAEINIHVDHEPQRCVRTERYKLTKTYPEAIIPSKENTDQSITRDYLDSLGYDLRKRTEFMLYDVLLDPNERINLAYDPAYSGILQNLTNRLTTWQLETKDPLVANL
jgi:arylsulfatase A-like enzyme